MIGFARYIMARVATKNILVRPIDCPLKGVLELSAGNGDV